MARIFWFAAGAVAGLAYASNLVNKERLNLPPGAEPVEVPVTEAKPDMKTKIADMIDQRTDQILTLIDERIIALTDKLHTAGHDLAAKLRGETDQPEIVVIDTITMIEPFETMSPVEQPTVASTAATPTTSTTESGTSPSDTGFEANR